MANASDRCRPGHWPQRPKAKFRARYKCRLNGKPLAAWDGEADAPPTIKVSLEPGVNRFLAKVTNNRHAYGFSFAVTGLHPKPELSGMDGKPSKLATRTARPFIAFQANDDFAVAKVSLRDKSEAIDRGAEKAIDLDLDGDSPTVTRRQYPWNLGELQLSESSIVEYWIEAQDNNNATGPGIGRSDHQFLRVVSPSEKLADIWNRAGDYMGSIDDLAGDEEKLNRSLETIILERTGPPR